MDHGDRESENTGITICILYLFIFLTLVLLHKNKLCASFRQISMTFFPHSSVPVFFYLTHTQTLCSLQEKIQLISEAQMKVMQSDAFSFLMQSDAFSF